MNLRRLMFANLLVQAAIIVTGVTVRVTGSGLGCPTWPQCVPGSYTPTVQQAQSWHKYVEFGNRTLTFALTAVAIATFVAVLRQRPNDRASRMLAAGCKQAKEWNESFRTPVPISVSMNLAPKFFVRRDLYEVMRTYLKQLSIDPSCLKLEITESQIMEDPPAVARMLERQIGRAHV